MGLAHDCTATWYARFSYRPLALPQRKLFTAIRISVQRDKSQKGDVSQFGALATALAATIGTGNIIGVATAVALGGPGAVFLVLAYRRVRHFDEVFRGVACYKIPCEV